MTRLRLALLNAAYTHEDTSRNFRRELDADLAEFVLTDGQLPPNHDFDGAVVTGSAASAYWDEEWIRDAHEWVREAHERDIPMLGVCFGHQLLASALGGRVEALADTDVASGVDVDDAGSDTAEEYEIGYRAIRRTAGDDADPVLAGLDESFTAFTTHGDTVTELPPGAERTAGNEYGVHGFRVGNAFGVQFHPEYDRESARRVTESKEFLGENRIERVLDGITDENYAKACETKRLFENFTDYAREVRETRAERASRDGRATTAGSRE